MNQESEVSRDFKGIWIPREIWLHPQLSVIEKTVWSEIDSLYKRDEGGCFATNEYLAHFFDVGVRRIQEILSKLKELRLLEIVLFNGRKRIMRATYVSEKQEDVNLCIADVQKSSWQTCRKVHGRHAEKCTSPHNTYSKEYNKEDNTSDPVIVSDHIDCIPTSDNLCSAPKSSALVNPPSPPKGGASSASAGLALFFFEILQKISPDMKKPSMIDWAKKFEIIMRIDKRSEEDLRKVIHYLLEQHQTATTDFTWAKACRSPDKLRKHYDAIVLQMQQKPKHREASQNIRELLQLKGFGHYSIHNGATCYLDEDYIAFERGINNKKLSLKEKGFWDQFKNLCSSFGIKS